MIWYADTHEFAPCVDLFSFSTVNFKTAFKFNLHAQCSFQLKAKNFERVEKVRMGFIAGSQCKIIIKVSIYQYFLAHLEWKLSSTFHIFIFSRLTPEPTGISMLTLHKEFFGYKKFQIEPNPSPRENYTFKIVKY